jgi:hypothetical protein
LVAEGRRWHLYRLAGDDQVEQIDVILGFESGDRVEIDHAADDDVTVSPGDRVVTLGAPALSDGAKVRVTDDSGESEDADNPADSEDSDIQEQVG